MQLTRKKKGRNKAKSQFGNLTGTLAAASCALLGSNVQAQNENETGPDAWQFDTALLYYGESDNRVTAVEGIVAAKKTFADDQLLDLKITIDSLTGASATGAVPQPDIQTFTRPSGRGNYQIAAGDIPLDDTFLDTRVQLNAQWTQRLGTGLAEHYTLSGGVQLSKEYDYLSLGLNGSLSRDFNQKNTTLSLGFAFSRDTLEPEGGRPRAFAPMLAGSDAFDEGEYDEQAFKQTRLDGDGDKEVTDLLLGISQIINRRLIMQFNYSYSISDGYLTDPFKLLSLVDEQGITRDVLFEQRPDKRTKHSFYWQSKYHFDWAIADVSYRFMSDDWEIDSHTIDTRLHFVFDGGSYLEPHLRYYRQDAAEFYRPFLHQSAALPEFASADYRIGEFSAYTIGFKYGMKLASGHALSMRLEYYQQNPTTAGFVSPGVLGDFELNPTLKAVIFQLGYSF